MTSSAAQQASMLGHLLVGQEPPAQAVELYQQAQALLPPCLPKEQALLDLMVDRPWLAGWVDGGLALSQPHHSVRRRILVMLAILECQPSLAPLFLPAAPVRFEIVTVLVAGVRAAVRAVVGAVLLKVLPHG